MVTGANLANYQLSIVPGVLTITQTGAALVLTASPTTAAAGASVLLTAALTGQNGVVPTGNVLFFDGATLLGTVASVNGTATLTVSTLAAGTHTLTAHSAGDANYGPALSNAVTETITGAGGGTGADYTITATPAGLTIKQGTSGSATLTVTPVNGYTGQITLGCVTLPENTSCIFTPATFTLNGTTPVTVALTVNTSNTIAGLREPEMPGQAGNMTSLAGFAMLPAVLLAGIFGWSRRKHRRGFAGDPSAGAAAGSDGDALALRLRQGGNAERNQQSGGRATGHEHHYGHGDAAECDHGHLLHAAAGHLDHAIKDLTRKQKPATLAGF